MGSHTAQPAQRLGYIRGWLRRPITPSFVYGSLIGLVAIFVGMFSVAFAVEPDGGQQIQCAPGVSIVLHPNGTWACEGQPTPTSSPSSSPSASPSTSPSASPTSSPSPSTSPSSSPTPTPTSSPTPTGSPTGPLALCMPRLAECGYPHLGNTGVPAGTTLTPYTGPNRITTADTVIDGKHINGCLTIRAAGVVIRNSLITSTGCFHVINMDGGTLAITDSEIDCVTGNGNGIAWARFAALRVYIHDCENALEMGAGSSVVDSYLHAREVGDGHADVIQSQGGNNVVVRHNTFAAPNPITASIITNPTANHNWLVEDNFFAAGAYTIYCPEQGTNFVVRNNRFYGPIGKNGTWTLDPFRPAFGFTDACGHSGIAWTGNYRDDTLGVVTA